MAGNTSSLYGNFVTTTGVNSNNFTTLYTLNAQEILPQLPYGNSNVEAFLNAGTDGGNTVQNILANGSITANGSLIANGLTITGYSNLGPVGNVHITGGIYNYVLTTDGAGNLTWNAPYVPVPPTPNPYIHFDVTVTANNQSFSNSGINAYGSNTYINLFKNGVNIEPQYFIKTSNNTVQVNIPLNSGDTIDILASDASTGSQTPAAGTTYDVQFNSSNQFAGTNLFTYQPGTNLLTVGNINSNITGNVGNFVTLSGNSFSPNYISGNGANITYITGSNVVGAVPSSNHALVSDVANSVSGANVLGYVANASHATIANTANVVNFANVANVVALGNQPNITSVGNLSGLTVTGVTNLGSVSNVKITGGTSGYVLSTDGTGNLSWTAGGGGGGGTPGGSNTQVQFNNSGSFGADSTFTFNSTSKVLSASYFSGNGYNLTSIAGPNVSGQVSFAAVANSVAVANVVGIGNIATVNLDGSGNVLFGNGVFGPITSTANSNYANYAGNAFSVSGSNVTGQVGYAAVANSVAGANVTGQVSYAAVANSVAGSNVSGYVANATHSNIADVANSVSVSNVTGIGNIAVLNLTGDSSNVLYGNGVFAPVPSYAANANYANYAGNAFSVSGSNVTGQVSYAAVANSVAGANVSGYVANATHATVSDSSNLVAGANVTGFVGNASFATVAASANSVTGANVSGTVNSATYATFVTANNQSNITSTGTLSNLSVSGNSILNTIITSNFTSNGYVNIQRAYEKVTPNATGSTGTITFDVLTQSIIYDTANATANFTVNIRGNSTTTLDSILPTNQSLTIVYLNTVGSSAYILSNLQIDGNTITPKYLNGLSPNIGIRLTNATQSYTYSIIKTAGNTYTVLGSLSEYQ